MSTLETVADHHGIISVADGRRAGLGAPDLERLVREGQLVSLARGWYAVGSPETPEERHALVTRAMVRSHEGRAVASHHSALCLLGLPTLRADWQTVRLSRVTSGAPRTRKGLSLGRCIPAVAVAAAPDGEPFPVTVVPALAVLQAGISAGPLASLVAADGALHQKLILPQDLDVALGWVQHHPRTAMLRPFLQLADARHASPGETRLRHAFHLMCLAVTPQHRVVAPGFLAFVDFVLDGVKVAIEFDGKVKYGRTLDAVDSRGRRLSPEEVLWAEKRREDRLRELGYEVVRVVWSELDNLAALARRIRAAIARARARGPAGLLTLSQAG